MPCLGEGALGSNPPGGGGDRSPFCFFAPGVDLPADGAFVLLPWSYKLCTVPRGAGAVHSHAGRWVTVKGWVEPLIREDCFLMDVDSLVVDGMKTGYRAKLMVYPNGYVGPYRLGTVWR